MRTTLLKTLTFSKVDSRSYACNAYWIKGKYQEKFKENSQGAWKEGHMVVADTAQQNSQGEVAIYVSATKGPGTKKNPSYFLGSSNIQGQAQEQRAIPLPENTYEDPKALSKAVRGSEEYFQQEEVQKQMRSLSESYAKDNPEERGGGS